VDPVRVVDAAFPEVDPELGDAYEQRGLNGIYQVMQSRRTIIQPEHLRMELAVHWGCSPADFEPGIEDLLMPSPSQAHSLAVAQRALEQAI
jgi:hypothetical protein